MKLLELFSGTGSVGNVAKDLDYDVVSLDRDMKADIKCDIMDFKYKDYSVGEFDVIWASPPCTEYSIAKTIGTRDIEGSNKVVQRTLEIINYLKPKYWIMENPQTGYLKKQSFMIDLPFKDVDYCSYGMPYRKRTRLWNNIFSWNPKPLCNKDCWAMDDDKKRHRMIAQRGATKTYTTTNFKQSELYRVPQELIIEIFQSINQ